MKKYQDIFQELRTYCHDYQPNDPTYVEENPEVTEQIDELDAVELTEKKEVLSGIQLATSFLEEWFPDEVDEDEQHEIRQSLDEGYAAIKELEEAH